MTLSLYDHTRKLEMAPKFILQLTWVILVILMGAGCGQSGPLILPPPADNPGDNANTTPNQK